MHKIVILFSFLFVLCANPKSYIYYCFVNNSDADIEFVYPCHPRNYLPFKNGDMNDIDPNDTTILNAIRLFARSTILSNTRHSVNSDYTALEQMSSYDTIRIFVIKHGDSMRIEQEGVDDYICRYDLSLNDLKALTNKSNEIEVCYPPDERMKEMKTIYK